MKATADRLLNRFAQGDVRIITLVSTPPANSWDDPTVTETRTVVDAVVRGVSKEFIDGTTILATDLQVLMGVSVDPGVMIEIDGDKRMIIRHDKIPASGVTVVNRYIVR